MALRMFFAETLRVWLYVDAAGEAVCWYDPNNPRTARYGTGEFGLPVVDTLPPEVVGQVDPPEYFERADFDDTDVSWVGTDVEPVGGGDPVGWLCVVPGTAVPDGTFDLGDPEDLVTKTTQQLNRNATRQIEQITARPRDTLAGMTRMEVMNEVCREGTWSVLFQGTDLEVYGPEGG